MKIYSQLTIHEKINLKGITELFSPSRPFYHFGMMTYYKPNELHDSSLFDGLRTKLFFR